MVNTATICMYMYGQYCYNMYIYGPYRYTMCVHAWSILQYNMYMHGTYPGLPDSLLTTHAHYIREEFVGAR